MKTRRDLLLALGAGALVSSRAWSQKALRTYRIGWLGSSAAIFSEPQAMAFVRRLSELGYVEGRNLVIERQHLDGLPERQEAVVAEFARLQCDVFFTSGVESNLAALSRVQPQTPIVLVAVDFDPVATGDVENLSRPGGRVTGVTAMQSTLPAKRLELMAQTLPSVKRISVFANEQTGAQLSLTLGTARRMGLAVHVMDFKRPPFHLDSGFSEAVRARSQALVVLGSGLWVPARRQIVDSAIKAGLPSVYHNSLWTEAGGLLSYGFNFPAMWRRGAEIVAEILRGAKPGDVPMEQPTALEFAINRKTAKALGITIPPAILVRADRIFD